MQAKDTNQIKEMTPSDYEYHFDSSKLDFDYYNECCSKTTATLYNALNDGILLFLIALAPITDMVTVQDTLDNKGGAMPVCISMLKVFTDMSPNGIDDCSDLMIIDAQKTNSVENLLLKNCHAEKLTNMTTEKKSITSAKLETFDYTNQEKVVAVNPKAKLTQSWKNISHIITGRKLASKSETSIHTGLFDVMTTIFPRLWNGFKEYYQWVYHQGQISALTWIGKQQQAKLNCYQTILKSIVNEDTRETVDHLVGRLEYADDEEERQEIMKEWKGLALQLGSQIQSAKVKQLEDKVKTLKGKALDASTEKRSFQRECQAMEQGIQALTDIVKDHPDPKVKQVVHQVTERMTRSKTRKAKAMAK